MQSPTDASSPLAPTDRPVPASPNQPVADNQSAAAAVVAASLQAAGRSVSSADPGWPPASSNQQPAPAAQTRPPEQYLPTVRELKKRHQPEHLLGKALRSDVKPTPDHLFTEEEISPALRRLFTIAEAHADLLGNLKPDHRDRSAERSLQFGSRGWPAQRPPHCARPR